MATTRKPWPRAADNNRIDTIALLLDIEDLCHRAYHELEADDPVAVAKVLGIINRKAQAGREYLREAKDIDPEVGEKITELRRPTRDTGTD